MDSEDKLGNILNEMKVKLQFIKMLGCQRKSST